MRKPSVIALICGVALVVGGFLYDVLFAGIPYQDPSPAMQQRYGFHSNVAFCIEMTGIIAILCGSVMWVARRRRRAEPSS